MSVHRQRAGVRPRPSIALLALLALPVSILHSVASGCSTTESVADGSTAVDSSGPDRPTDSSIPVDGGAVVDGGASMDSGAAADSGAAMDTGATSDSGMSTDSGTPATCGNGLVESGELCDDGNRVDVDLCNNDCNAARPVPEALTPIFSVPTTAGESTAMQDEVLRLIRMAAPGSSIRLSMYLWSRTRFVTALGDAADRGVDVRVVLDGHGPSDAVVAALNSRLGATRVHRCVHADPSNTSCIGDGINHNKFFLFSALTDGSTDVVAQSSANLNAGQVLRHNNMVIVRGNRAIYDYYFAYWGDLRAAVQNLDYYRSLQSGSVKAYFFPRATGDTIISVLGNVHCDPGTPGRGRVRVTMAFFTNGRDDVADALADKQREGCDVRVIIGTYTGSPGSRVSSSLSAAGVPMTAVPDDGPNIHSKYMLVEARYGAGPAIEQLVFTGSHNYTGPALRNHDEALMRIADADVFDAYWRNWQTIRAQSP